MIKYFRSLLKLFRFFLDDEFLCLLYPKNDFYYPVVRVVFQLLKGHFSEPFKETRTLKIHPDYVLSFQSWVLMPYNICNPEQVMQNALSERLLQKFGFAVTNVSFNNGVISSFTYTYL